jgi:hypothetical protein
MSARNQLLVVVGLTIAILAVGTHECSRVQSEPVILATARSASEPRGAPEAGPGSVGRGMEEARSALAGLLTAALGDSGQVFLDSAEVESLLVSEQYGEWGANDPALRRAGLARELVGRLLKQTGSR